MFSVRTVVCFAALTANTYTPCSEDPVILPAVQRWAGVLCDQTTGCAESTNLPACGGSPVPIYGGLSRARRCLHLPLKQTNTTAVQVRECCPCIHFIRTRVDEGSTRKTCHIRRAVLQPTVQGQTEISSHLLIHRVSNKELQY